MGEENEPSKATVSWQLAVLVALCAGGTLLALHDLAAVLGVFLIYDISPKPVLQPFSGIFRPVTGGRTALLTVQLLCLPFVASLMAFPALILVMRRRRAGAWLFAGTLAVYTANGWWQLCMGRDPALPGWRTPAAVALLIAALPLVLSARTWQGGEDGREERQSGDLGLAVLKTACLVLILNALWTLLAGPLILSALRVLTSQGGLSLALRNPVAGAMIVWRNPLPLAALVLGVASFAPLWRQKRLGGWLVVFGLAAAGMYDLPRHITPGGIGVSMHGLVAPVALLIAFPLVVSDCTWTRAALAPRAAES